MQRFTEGVEKLIETLTTATASTKPLSDASSGRHELPEDYDNTLWRLGLSDGRLGQSPKEHDDILKSLAEKTWREELHQAELLVDAKQKEFVALEQARVELDRRAAENDSSLAAIEEQRREERGEFAHKVGWFYVFLGILLFVADIPLSLKFVSDAFDISVDSSLVEAMLVALGVAGVGFFFKIVTDYLIAPPRSRNLTRSWYDWSRFGLAVVFMGAIAAATVSTLWYVGEVRAVAKHAQTASAPTPGSTGKGTLSSSIGTGGTPAPIGSTDIIDTGFKLMAFTFPLVGAVCVAVGLRKVQNGGELRRLEKKSQTIRKQYQETAERVELCTRELARLQEKLARAVARKGDDYRLWRGIYLHGYLRGTCTPESLNDGLPVHQLVERMAERWLAIVARGQNRRLGEEVNR